MISTRAIMKKWRKKFCNCDLRVCISHCDDWYSTVRAVQPAGAFFLLLLHALKKRIWSALTFYFKKSCYQLTIRSILLQKSTKTVWQQWKIPKICLWNVKHFSSCWVFMYLDIISSSENGEIHQKLSCMIPKRQGTFYFFLASQKKVFSFL